MAELAVIMPCHNGAATIEQAVRSVLAQTFTNWELLIVNDGSTDSSPDLIAQLAAEDQRIHVLTNENASGAAAARNRALKHAETRYVAFLDCDDGWLPYKLEVQLAAMREHGAALVCGAYDIIDAEGKIIGSVQPRPGKLTYRSMLANNSVGCLTAVLDRSLCGPVQFDPSLPRSEDYHLWLTILKRGLTGICVPEKVGLYRLHGKTLSSNKLSAARNRWRVYREFEKHNAFISAFYFIAYAATGAWKTLFMRRKQLLGRASG